MRKLCGGKEEIEVSPPTPKLRHRSSAALPEAKQKLLIFIHVVTG